MAGLLWWESTHALCIFGHLGMVVTSFIAFVFTRGELGTSDQFMSLKAVPFAGFGVGAIATFTNLNLFAILLHLQRHARDEPVNARYFKKKITTLIGCIFNLSFIAADISVAANLKKSSNQVADSGSSAYLNSACALAVISAVMAFATTVADTVKIFGDRAHQRDFDEQFEYQRSGPIQLP